MSDLRSLEVVKPKTPAQRDGVDRPRVPPQDDWNVHVKFTNNRGRGRKSSTKENTLKVSAKKSHRKGVPQLMTPIQSAPWNVVAGGSWNCPPPTPEAPLQRTIVSAMPQMTTAAPTQPQIILREDTRSSSPAAQPATRTPDVSSSQCPSWNVVARQCNQNAEPIIKPTASSTQRSLNADGCLDDSRRFSLDCRLGRATARVEKPCTAVCSPTKRKDPTAIVLEFDRKSGLE
ncbi:GL14399 [Drosophila persimilis]|uniref:GL14399 n=1 Tax=Drosophila persimilis TaxID=7234 RepID=B4GTQ6_DROPE|nr:GL14399 [Drosophila persimilis]